MLTVEDTKRYGRQIILREVGLEGQKRIMESRVLIVGMGGLGSPCSLYLAGAGIGTLGLLDFDVVEKSNLNRQIIHSEATVGLSKVESSKRSILNLNSKIMVNKHEEKLQSFDDAVVLIQNYDVVVDCTDNVQSRYLLSDVCSFLQKPLVSGSAQGLYGQLTVFYKGPCYRCLFPQPPKEITCEDSGILGPVTGVIGSLQAMETLKIILQNPSLVQKLMFVDFWTMDFKTYNLRNKNPNCFCCLQNTKFDYSTVCSIPIPYRIKANQIKSTDLIIDVRPEHEFKICSINNSKNIQMMDLDTVNFDCVVICRRGNDSQLAVTILREKGLNCVDVEGGLEAYALENLDFAMY